MNVVKRLVPTPVKKKIKHWLKMDEKKYSMDKTYILKRTDPGRFYGKIAVVTGGSGAIGRAICLRLAAEGATVYVAGRTEKHVEKVVTEICGLGLTAYSMILDVTEASQVEKIYTKAFPNENSRLDIQVNCAGGGAREKADYLYREPVETLDRVLNENLRGSMLCSREAAKRMVRQRAGKIINIASVIGLRGMIKYTDYAAAKAGVIGYTASLAMELGKYGINVNCVSPGYIQRGEYGDQELAFLKKTNYLEKVGTLEDVASAVAFLSSEEAGFITGQNLAIDGGRSLGLHGAE